MGGNRIRCRRTCVDGSYRLCTGAATTVIIAALVGAGPTLSMVSGFNFFVGILYHSLCV